MDKIKKLLEDEFNKIVIETGFSRDLLVKDYYITILLFLIKDIEGIYFKGGTALQLTMLEHARISEDIDFTLNKPLSKINKQIIEKINSSKLFGKITKDKDVEGFTRLIVPYKTELGTDRIFIDLNKRGKILLKSEQIEMNHFYPNIPKFKTTCLNKKEMIAEKVAAAIGRNKPRDHYDIYQIIKHNLPIDLKLVRKKCKQSNQDPSILKMFNKAKKLHKKWDQGMIPLLKDEVFFKEVMQTLAKHFNLKQVKEDLKK